MGRWELRLRVLLRQCSLIGELALSEDELRAIVTALNKLHEQKPDLSLEEVCQRYSATIAVFLTFTGVYWYNEEGKGEYWSRVWEYLPWPDTQTNRVILSEAFTRVVCDDYYQLIPLSRPTQRKNVDPILFHAMVPTQSLPALFEQMVSPLAEDPELSWTHLSTIYLPRPARDFLEMADRVAGSFLGRCARLLRHLDESDGASRDPAELVTEYGLASHVVCALLDWRTCSPVWRASSRYRGLRLTLDPYGNGVELEIPPAQVTEVRPSYSATIDENVGRVEFEVQLDLHNSGQTLARKYPAHAPQETYSVQIPELSTEYRARGVTDQPVYFCPRTGRRLPDGSVPEGVVWVIAPRGMCPIGDGGRAVLLEDLPALPGAWRPWSASTLDTTHCTYVEWRQQQTNTIVCATPVQGAEKLVRLEGKSVGLPFVSAADLPPVYTAAPNLWLPIRGGEADYDRWHVEVVNHQEAPIFADTLDALCEELCPTEDGVLLHLSSPRLLGAYSGTAEITVRGPIGDDAFFTCAVVPDITIETLPLRYLRFEGGRPTPCDLLLKPTAPLTITAKGGRVTPTGQHHLVTPETGVAEVLVDLRPDATGAGRVELPFRVIPLEWCFVTIPTTGEPQWGTAPFLLRADAPLELVEKSLLVRTYFNEPVRLRVKLLINGEPAPVHVEHQLRAGIGRVRVELNRFHDALLTHINEEVELHLEVSGEEFAWQAHVATIELNWRVENLLVFMNEGSACCLQASWQEISPPNGQRQLTLRDLWRPGRTLSAPIPDSASRVVAEFSRSELLPGRYKVGFEVPPRWGRTARRPVKITPQPILEIGKDEWAQLVAGSKTPAQWLVAAHAWLDIGRVERQALTLPRKALWQETELIGLGGLLIQATQAGQMMRFAPLIRKWATDESTLFRVTEAFATTVPKADVRTVALALELHVRPNPGKRPTGLATYASWPVLAALHGFQALPPLQCPEEHAWGLAYALRDPEAVAHGAPEGLSQHAPGALLATWLGEKGSKSSLQHLEDSGQIFRAVESMQAYHARLVGFAKEFRKKGDSPLESVETMIGAHDDLLRALQMRESALAADKPVASRTVQLAYVCAAFALLQRMMAREYAKMGRILDPYPEWIDVSIVCPPLHDYYLLLAETYYRKADPVEQCQRR